MHVAVTTPAETIDLVRSYSSIVSSFARKRSGSASALSVSRLAQRSLGLQPTCSPSRLNGPLHQRLRQLCYLRRRFDCYRAERTSSRVGLPPTGYISLLLDILFGSFLPSLWSSNNHSLLGSRSRHCYAIKWKLLRIPSRIVSVCGCEAAGSFGSLLTPTPIQSLGCIGDAFFSN